MKNIRLESLKRRPQLKLFVGKKCLSGRLENPNEAEYGLQTRNRQV